MQKKMMMIGEKESFLVRVLLNKCNSSGINSEFVPWTVNDINAKWEGTSFVTLFLEERGRVPQDVKHFLIDRMKEGNQMMILVGEKSDLTVVAEEFPKELIFREFQRPVNNEEFVDVVTELLNKMVAGDFKKNILIVDDDPNYLSLVREWLRDNYKVYMANSGLQAIKWLGKNKADLILLDHEMPVTSGPQVLEMLRSDTETKDIPVMFLTGKGDKESVMAVLALKPEGYFLKNIEKAELLEKLDEFFVLRK